MSGWIPSGTIDAFGTLDLTGVTDEDVLMYDSSNSTWKPALPSVPLLSETAGHVLELEDGTIVMGEPTFRN